MSLEGVTRNGGFPARITALAFTFSPYQNSSSPVYLHYRNQRARISLELGRDWTVKSCQELIAALNELEAVKQAALRY